MSEPLEMSRPDALPFDLASSPERQAPGLWRWQVPDGWQQGRGAFGGLVLAAMTRAASAHVQALDGGADSPLRSLTAHLCGPVMASQAATLRVEALRVGHATMTVSVALLQEDEVKAHAVCLFGRARQVQDTWMTATPPEGVGGWEQASVIPVGPPLGPVFAAHYEYRPLAPLPFSGPEQPRLAQGWARPRRPGQARDEALLVGLTDCWWPAAYTAMRGPRPMATVTYTLELLDGWGDLAAHSPLFHRATMPASAQGYAVELRELWAPDGRLLALNQQTMALIK